VHAKEAPKADDELVAAVRVFLHEITHWIGHDAFHTNDVRKHRPSIEDVYMRHGEDGEHMYMNVVVELAFPSW